MALEVIFDGDIAPLNKKIKEAEHNLQDFANEKAYRIKLGLDTTEVDKNIKSVKTELSSLKTTLKDTGNAVSGDFTKKVASGSNALTQFGRIAQDAPFGIMGIGNNITATAESFGYLVKETGSAGGALKAVASSIMGTGGILLAVSLVTSGLTYMAQKGITVSDVFNQMSGTFDKTRKEMQDLSVETAKNAQAQISSVGAYVSVAKNINLSMNDRLIAVKKLQDEYPAYFGNLTKEQILNGNVAEAVRGVTQALIAKAKASALTDRIVKLAEEEEKIQNNINNSIAAQFKQYRLTKQEAFDAAVVLNKQLRGEIDLEKELTDGRANGLSKAEKTALAAYKYSQTLQGLGGELKSNIYQQDKLTNSLEKSYAASIKLEQQQEKAGKKANVTPQVSKLDSGGLGGSGIVETAQQLKQLADGTYVLDYGIQTSMKNIVQHVKDGTMEMLKLLEDFNNAASSLITGALTSTFENLGTAIGTALAQGKNVFGAIGKTLISAMGAFLSDMGSLLIKYGTLAVAKGVIDKALTSGNPVVTVAAGVAAIAVGVALKGVGAAISSKAGGSSGSIASYSTGASYSSPASSVSSGGGGSSSFGSGTVVFEIAGTTLLGVLNNTLDKNKRLGGSLGL